MNLQAEDQPTEPTAIDCDSLARGLWNGQHTMALWFPQLGGYSARAVAVMAQDEIDVYVWHDSPFRPDNPRKLHMCSPLQFISFGVKLDRFKDEVNQKPSKKGWLRGLWLV